jgi:hypothetical protein
MQNGMRRKFSPPRISAIVLLLFLLLCVPFCRVRGVRGHPLGSKSNKEHYAREISDEAARQVPTATAQKRSFNGWRYADASAACDSGCASTWRSACTL